MLALSFRQSYNRAAGGAFFKNMCLSVPESHFERVDFLFQFAFLFLLDLIRVALKAEIFKSFDYLQKLLILCLTAVCVF